jgi:hypothetical protein
MSHRQREWVRMHVDASGNGDEDLQLVLRVRLVSDR